MKISLKTNYEFDGTIVFLILCVGLSECSLNGCFSVNFKKNGLMFELLLGYLLFLHFNDTEVFSLILLEIRSFVL